MQEFPDAFLGIKTAEKGFLRQDSKNKGPANVNTDTELDMSTTSPVTDSLVSKQLPIAGYFVGFLLCTLAPLST